MLVTPPRNNILLRRKANIPFFLKSSITKQQQTTKKSVLPRKSMRKTAQRTSQTRMKSKAGSVLTFPAVAINTRNKSTIGITSLAQITTTQTKKLQSTRFSEIRQRIGQMTAMLILRRVIMITSCSQI